MVAGQQELPSSDPGSNVQRIALWSRVIAVVLAIGFPITALLASEALYKGSDSMRNMHEMLGNVFFLLAIAQLVLGFMAMKSGSLGMSDVVMQAVFVVLVVAQLGLGYAGRENIDVRIWHVPNGVLLMGLAGVIAARSFPRSRV